MTDTPTPTPPPDGLREELKPCPYCGSASGARIFVQLGWTAPFIVHCVDGCGAMGPNGGSEEQAIAMWNTRASALAPEGDWVLVPREPTDAMVAAGARECCFNSGEIGPVRAKAVWGNMVRRRPWPRTALISKGEPAATPAPEGAREQGRKFFHDFMGSDSYDQMDPEREQAFIELFVQYSRAAGLLAGANAEIEQLCEAVRRSVDGIEILRGEAQKHSDHAIRLKYHAERLAASLDAVLPLLRTIQEHCGRGSHDETIARAAENLRSYRDPAQSAKPPADVVALAREMTNMNGYLGRYQLSRWGDAEIKEHMGAVRKTIEGFDDLRRALAAHGEPRALSAAPEGEGR